MGPAGRFHQGGAPLAVPKCAYNRSAGIVPDRAAPASAAEATVGSEEVLYEKSGHVATITINRPERMNAFNAAVHRRIPEPWEEVKRDDAVQLGWELLRS